MICKLIELVNHPHRSRTAQVNLTPRVQESFAVLEATDLLAEGKKPFDRTTREKEGTSTTARTAQGDTPCSVN